jgi:hypothetical protein
MRIAHLIPTSFNYFDDIKKEAFALIEAENERGIEVEAFTLQYGTPGLPKEQSEVASAAPSRKFGGTAPWPKLLDELASFDVVHVHCPFFGALPRLVAWKRSNINVPLVITIYRAPIITDLFSHLAKWYNNWYLPQLAACADLVAVASYEHLSKRLIANIKMLVTVDYSGTFGELPVSHATDGTALAATERLAVKYQLIYTQLVAQAHNQ